MVAGGGVPRPLTAPLLSRARRSYRRPIDLVAAARAEVVGLHEFFVGWFTGALDGSGAVFARFAEALHPDFSMTGPSGETLDREAVLGSVREAHGTAADTLSIEIRGVIDRAVSEDGVLLTYEEWQFAGEQLVNRRMSTAYFVRAAAAPSGVLWRHLHETFRTAGV